MISANFVITSLLIVLLPGTGVIYTITTGLTSSRRNVAAAALGCTLGIVPHILASIFGLSAIMNMSARIFFIIRFAGAGYLLYLAFMTWKSAGKMAIENQSFEKSFFKTASRAILINLLNPKLTIFFLSFLPQFINRDADVVLSMLILSLIFMSMTFAAFLCYGFLAGSIKKLVLRKNSILKYIERSFAVVFAGFAVKIAIDKTT